MKKKIKPIIVEELSSEKFVRPVFKEKRETNGIPEGHVRVLILKECEGMTGIYQEGDIIDLPDRRFKSLRLRGLCEEYKGKEKPTRER